MHNFSPHIRAVRMGLDWEERLLHRRCICSPHFQVLGCNSRVR